MTSIPLGRLLIAGVVAGIIGISSAIVMPQSDNKVTQLTFLSDQTVYSVGDTFTVAVATKSSEPVNVFKGLITFDPQIVQVSAIDYNTSFLDLWAEEPWYSNGDGTISFTGGTTIEGGFTGQATILTITFTAKSVGNSALSLKDIRVLKHDGLGTDVLVGKPMDTIFSIDNLPSGTENTAPENLDGPILKVLPPDISTDLNNDGKQTIADVSIFMKHLATGNLASDFDQDGSVGLSDLSILMKK